MRPGAFPIGQLPQGLSAGWTTRAATWPSWPYTELIQALGIFRQTPRVPRVPFSLSSSCESTEGKDRIIFVTKEDHEAPSSAELVADDPSDPYEEHGLILPNGDINWNCPCLGGMASGPCGEQFKSAFSCFHYSTEDIKGSDCVNQFRAMQECMQKYPDLYPQDEEEEEEEGEEKPAERAQETGPTEAAAAQEQGSS
ncbi:mitochondrial intermembrane space import and assembly protein 40 isoform 1-T1 [Thomomys bottae]